MSIEVLIGAKWLLQNQGWTKGTFARDRYGLPVPVFDKTADSFDLSGAIIFSAGGMNASSNSASNALAEGMNEPIPDWHDHSTFAEVIACVDETIATLRSRMLIKPRETTRLLQIILADFEGHSITAAEAEALIRKLLRRP